MIYFPVAAGNYRDRALKMAAMDNWEELLKDDIGRRVRSWLEEFKGDSEAMFSIGRAIELVYGRRTTGKGKAESYFLSNERELIQYALDFANKRTDRSEMRRYAEGPAPNVARSIIFQEMTVRPGEQAADALLAEKTLEDNLRKGWRDFLTGLVRERAKAIQQFGERAERATLRSVWLLPDLKITKGVLRLGHHIVLPDRSAFDAYVSLLLLDQTRDFGKDLRQCQLQDCRIFFLVKKQMGRPQLRYCCPDHMEKAHQLGSTERSRKARKMANARKAAGKATRRAK